VVHGGGIAFTAFRRTSRAARNLCRNGRKSVDVERVRNAAAPGRRKRRWEEWGMNRGGTITRGFGVGLFTMALAWAEAPAEAARLASVSMTLTTEAWRNTSGGRQTGGWGNAFADVTAILDGRCLGGATNSRLVAQIHAAATTDDSLGTDYTGASNATSGLLAADHLRVFNFHYRMAAANGGWEAKIGQLALDDDFMLSDYAALFANAAFGAMPSQVATSRCSDCPDRAAFAVFPVAAPGAWVQLAVSPASTWQTGLYYGGPGPDAWSNHGFSWSSGDDAGLVVFTEWTQRFGGETPVATLRAGFSGYSGPVDDYDAERAGRSDSHPHGLYGAYAIADVVLAADAHGQPKLGAFARGGVSPMSARSVVVAYGDAGLNWFGPIAARPADVAGVAISASRFGSAVQSVTGVAATETTVELTYRLQVSERCFVQADAQWRFQPAPNAASAQRETAAVVGLRTQFRF
jgi:porin